MRALNPIRQKVRSGTLPLSLQYLCNWLVRWKHEPAAFFSEWWIAIRYHRVWRQSFENKTEPLDHGNPWLAGNVIAFMKAEVKPSHTVFDWVCIDGRARPSCLLAGKPKVKPGGWIMLDNSRRDHYQPALSGFAAWRHVRITGPVCGSRNFVETLFLQRPHNEASVGAA